MEASRLGIHRDVSRLRLRKPGDEIDDCAHVAILRPSQLRAPEAALTSEQDESQLRPPQHHRHVLVR